MELYLAGCNSPATAGSSVFASLAQHSTSLFGGASQPAGAVWLMALRPFAALLNLRLRVRCLRVKFGIVVMGVIIVLCIVVVVVLVVIDVDVLIFCIPKISFAGFPSQDMFRGAH